MKKIKNGTLLVLGTILIMVSHICAETVARISRIEGKVSVLKNGAENWRDGKVNMPLSVGDAVYSRVESFAEIVYTSGAVLRMDEETKIIIEAVTEKGAKASTPVGNVWANMKKLVTSKKEFELISPTATAAIRGTIFQMNTSEDSTTDVSVYQGKVAVGPNKLQQKQTAPPSPGQEVQGPTEVPGPYEVSLEHWRTIVSGQRISVNKAGKYKEGKIDEKKAEQDEFVKKNRDLDRSFEKELEEKINKINNE